MIRLSSYRSKRLESLVDPRFVIDPFEPAYLRSFGPAREAALAERVRAALEELSVCRVCPRNCRVNRLAGDKKVCNTGRHAIVSSAFAHFGEEDVLRGVSGSGTIFFGLCNLRCVFCQNWDISQEQRGRELDAERIADLMLELQGIGCHNINFVTPEHVAPQVVEAIARAIERGLFLPIVYNTSAYDSIRSLELMEGLVDIYMPDFKFWTYASSRDLARAKDYPEVARAAIKEMHRQVGELRTGRDGLARRGLLVRHLVMPGRIDEARAIFEWLATEISPDTWVNVMDQYRPEHLVGTTGRDGEPRYRDIDRRISGREHADALLAAREAGLWRIDTRV